MACCAAVYWCLRCLQCCVLTMWQLCLGIRGHLQVVGLGLLRKVCRLESTADGCKVWRHVEHLWQKRGWGDVLRSCFWVCRPGNACLCMVKRYMRCGTRLYMGLQHYAGHQQTGDERAHAMPCQRERKDLIACYARPYSFALGMTDRALCRDSTDFDAAKLLCMHN